MEKVDGVDDPGREVLAQDGRLLFPGAGPILLVEHQSRVSFGGGDLASSVAGWHVAW